MQLKRISILRHYYQYSGGHQKVRDYISHFQSLGLETQLHIATHSEVIPPLFSNIPGAIYTDQYRPDMADIIFLAGMDWKHYLGHDIADKPIINLIQHVKHGDVNSPQFQYLQHYAVRICVSDAVKEAILPHANGPCITIPLGHQIPRFKEPKSNELYIQALKQPELGRIIYNWAKAKGVKVILHDTRVPRELALKTMSKSCITLPLPHSSEGFFLPAIEAMALSDVAVIPACVAHRTYCKPLTNTVNSELTEESIICAIETARRSLGTPILRFKKYYTNHFLKKFTLERERTELQRLLKGLDLI